MKNTNTILTSLFLAAAIFAASGQMFHTSGQDATPNQAASPAQAQQADAAGVHQREGFSAPLGLGGDAVARDAGLVMHNRNPLFDNAVEQRGFADIWPSDDGDEI